MEGIGAKGLKTKLIVNYIPQSLTDNEFRNLFEGIGALENCKILRDNATNYSFGYGFVDYQKPECAEQAIQELNGHKIGNKTLSTCQLGHVFVRKKRCQKWKVLVPKDSKQN